MNDTDKKIVVIDRICELHPVYGLHKNWSWYVGGMRDTGDWNFRQMLNVPMEELEDFLIETLLQPEPQEPVYTEQELLDQKEMIDLGFGVVISRYQLNQEKKFVNEMGFNLRHGLKLVRGINGEIL